MSEPFIGEVKIFGFNFAPRGWALCNGQLLPISQNTALFSLLGTQFGGNGKTNFALPNLQGEVPLHQGQGPGLSARQMGETAGLAAVTLQTSNMPAHTHAVSCSTASGTSASPAGNVWATAGTRGAGINEYSGTAGSSPTLAPAAVGTAGGSQPHNNMPPYLVVNFCIALQGIFPQRG
jgi:microcystin-dependent protein